MEKSDKLCLIFFIIRISLSDHTIDKERKRGQGVKEY